MNLLGLPPWMFATGLAGLAGTLLVLHMLRVRLRRVERVRHCAKGGGESGEYDAARGQAVEELPA